MPLSENRLSKGQQKKAAVSDSGPAVCTHDAQPMNSQPGKPSVLPTACGAGGDTPVIYVCRAAFAAVTSTFGQAPGSLLLTSAIPSPTLVARGMDSCLFKFPSRTSPSPSAFTKGAGAFISTVARHFCSSRTLTATASSGRAAFGFDRKNDLTPSCRAAWLAELWEARSG
jgi:hypothetical protein